MSHPTNLPHKITHEMGYMSMKHKAERMKEDMAYLLIRSFQSILRIFILYLNILIQTKIKLAKTFIQHQGIIHKETMIICIVMFSLYMLHQNLTVLRNICNLLGNLRKCQMIIMLDNTFALNSIIRAKYRQYCTYASTIHKTGAHPAPF